MFLLYVMCWSLFLKFVKKRKFWRDFFDYQVKKKVWEGTFILENCKGFLVDYKNNPIFLKVKENLKITKQLKFDVSISKKKLAQLSSFQKVWKILTVGFWCQTIYKKFLRRFDTIFGLKMMVKSGLEKVILKFHDGLQSCCCPVQKNLPRKAELAWQVSRYL